ncbi:hypothetical protein EN829_053450, partial [Mesorhizobium sp. M00.F.Ca.ET.186.01.1.1]
MPSKTDDQLLNDMKGLPDMKMNQDKKQEIISTIRSTGTHSLPKRTAASPGRFSALGKGLAVCSVL